MLDKHLVSMGSKSFEDLKKVNEYGAEYWSAREIQPLLGYTQWRRFEDAVKRAITSCKQSGNESLHHFAGVGKMIDIGKGGSKEVRAAIKRIGGTPPEHLPPAEHIKLVEKRLEGEADRKSTCKDFLQVQKKGQRQLI